MAISRAPSRRGLAVAVAVLALTASACVDAAPEGREPAPAGVTRSLDAGEARRTGAPIPEPPTRLRLPSGVWVPVRPAPTGRRGVLGVPGDVRVAGWWPGGAKLGDPFGTTLVAGHVDATDQGIGAFAELLALRPGQRVRMLSHHLEQVFTVESRRLVDRDDLRDSADLWSVRGVRQLTLVTCAPPYEPDRGGYQNLAVVTASATSDTLLRSPQ